MREAESSGQSQGSGERLPEVPCQFEPAAVESGEFVGVRARRASRKRLGRRSTGQRWRLVVRANGPEGGRATSLRWWTGHREHKLKEQGLAHSSESITGQAQPKVATRAGPPRRTKQPLKPLAQLLTPLGRSSDWALRHEGQAETPRVADPKAFEPSPGAAR